MPENEDLTPNEAPEAKAARRQAVADQVSQWQREGGIITQCPPCTFSRREYKMARLQYGKVSEEFTEGDE